MMSGNECDVGKGACLDACVSRDTKRSECSVCVQLVLVRLRCPSADHRRCDGAKKPLKLGDHLRQPLLQTHSGIVKPDTIPAVRSDLHCAVARVHDLHAVQ